MDSCAKNPPAARGDYSNRVHDKRSEFVLRRRLLAVAVDPLGGKIYGGILSQKGARRGAGSL
jgi:hypothetical protein